MGGIKSTFGIPLLNAITCNTVDLYNANSNEEPINYIEYDRYGNQSEHIKETFFSYKYSDVFTDIIDKSYLGLLIEQPIYYMGGANVEHPALSLINIENSETAAQTKSFLNIREIPNHSHHSLLSNETGNNHYWPEYSRAFLGELIYNSEKKQYYVSQTIMTGATLETNYTQVLHYSLTTDTVRNPEKTYYYYDGISNNYKIWTGGAGEPSWSGYTIYEATIYEKPSHQIINKNSQGLFLGENTLSYNWPAIKYFGLFRKSTDENNNYIHVRSDSTDKWYYIESTPDLYLWGELSETDDWYHIWTYDSSVWPSIYSNLWYKIDNTWIQNSSSVYDSSKVYYEKLGIIIKNNESAAFSTGEFKLIFENNAFIPNSGV